MNIDKKKYIPLILCMIFCIVYCFCISLVNIYRPIVHMDISVGILLRLSVIVVFLTLLTGMIIVHFTKRKYWAVIPVIMPILLWGSYMKLFPYRSFIYMGISVLVYFTYISILWFFGKENKKIKSK